ncbi:hypothetical protein EYF80_052070 [Liparis tanakae]|uniref:Uncharacterized protein n=1 Tax=Liparis tanakae TaxID=230148 RepID=A0A4Z2F991_9TELE|nr:hypothetical protein EYF80_052070 [Liparis tanakae]
MITPTRIQQLWSALQKQHRGPSGFQPEVQKTFRSNGRRRPQGVKRSHGTLGLLAAPGHGGNIRLQNSNGPVTPAVIGGSC